MQQIAAKTEQIKTRFYPSYQQYNICMDSLRILPCSSNNQQNGTEMWPVDHKTCRRDKKLYEQQNSMDEEHKINIMMVTIL